MAPPADPGRGHGDRPPTRPVRHPYWKYPLLALVAAGLIGGLAGAFGSPNWPRDTIVGVSNKDPGGAVLAFTQELDGSSSSWSNTRERGFGPPDQIFVLNPVSDFAPLLGPRVSAAVAAWRAATPDQQRAWASEYEKALGTITPQAGSGMGATPSPDYSKIGGLQGDFGPVPVLVATDLILARDGHLDHNLLAADPGHAFHLVNIWLYDHPGMLNQASANGLTDDQWGMIKERGFGVGPWYLILPNIVHVKFPSGSTGGPFVAWNVAIALFFMFGLTLIPGVRDLPKHLRLYRLIYRYPLRGERPPVPPPTGSDSALPMPAVGSDFEPAGEP
jgi:hypothetical protein